jgi:hypothetical protein
VRVATWREGPDGRHRPKASGSERRLVGVGQGRAGSLTGGPRGSQTRFEPTSKSNSNEIKFDSNRSNFDQPKKYLLSSKY